MVAFPYSAIVPRELEANLEFRERMSKEGYSSPKKAAVLRTMCRADPLFFIDTFCWTHNSMWFPNCPRQPFITHPFQQRLIGKILNSLARVSRFMVTGERTDLGCVKSRETGATWTFLYTMFHRWLFFQDQSFLLVSRGKDMVDKPEDLDALMPKLDFALRYLPRWLRPKLGTNDRVDLKMFNPHTSSMISGTATTGDIGRGGRRQAILLDEFGFFDRREGYAALKAVQGASLCCWYLSTPNGTANAFYDTMHDAEIEKIELAWDEMPVKRAGLYRATDGKLEILDKDFEFPANYKFILDGDLRSVWYDAIERRTPIKSLMAQEHDRSFVGSGSPFFTSAELSKIKETVCEPRDRISFRLSDGKPTELSIWCRKEQYEKPPADRRYVLGVDVALGTGATPGCICVLDGKTGEKIAEYADPDTDPRDLANIAAQIGRKFRDWEDLPALIIWEIQGCGRSFGKRMVELDYEHTYYASSIVDPVEQKQRFAGFNASPTAKQAMLRGLAVALGTGEFVEKSPEAAKEYERFEFFLGGQVAHAKSMAIEDPSGARENHGDRVTANGLAVHGLKSLGEAVPQMEDDGGPTSGWLHDVLAEQRRTRKQKQREDSGWLTYPSGPQAILERLEAVR